MSHEQLLVEPVGVAGLGGSVKGRGRAAARIQARFVATAGSRPLCIAEQEILADVVVVLAVFRKTFLEFVPAQRPKARRPAFSMLKRSPTSGGISMFRLLSERFAGNAENIGRMMKHTGYDAIHAGEAPYLFGAAVRRCAFCRHMRECAQWLDAVAPGASAPDFCPNRAFFEAARLDAALSNR